MKGQVLSIVATITKDKHISPNASVADFFSMVQFSCSKEISNHAGKDFHYKELTATGKETLLSRNFMSGYWMGLIMLAGNNFHTTLKIFFNTDEVKKLLADRFRKEPSEIDNKLVTDFMSEYCNLAAGGSKRALEATGLAIGISLPIITRSFDDLFNLGSNVLRHEHTFELFNDSNSFRCAVEFETSTEQAFVDFKWSMPEEDEEDDDDDMEFL